MPEKEANAPTGFISTVRDLVLSLKLGSSLQADVYKGYFNADPAKQLIIKRIKRRPYTASVVNILSHQIDQSRAITDPKVIIPSRLIEEGEEIVLIQRYIAGQTLCYWLESRDSVALKDFFKIAIRITDHLSSVHNGGIIHRGLKPGNILVAGDSLDVYLLDVVRCFDETELSHFIYDEKFRHKTLAYISPEQTGRIHQRVDYPADFYSLGVIFYQLLTMRRPFWADDPLALIHSHLADDIVPVHTANPDIPKALSSLVAKLLAKQPEKRYRSCASLVEDLKRCENQPLWTESP